MIKTKLLSSVCCLPFSLVTFVLINETRILFKLLWLRVKFERKLFEKSVIENKNKS